MNCKCYNSNLIDNDISYICSDEYNYFFKKPNVLGVGLGYKTKNGFSTYNKCIKVFVEKKIPYNNLPDSMIVPTIYKGIPTDVVESGLLNSQMLVDHVRPVIGGYSISPVEFKDKGGSMGCVVTDGYYKYILSNNHVLTDINQLPIGTQIVQPSIYDKGNPKEDVIAILSKYVPLKVKTTFSEPTNYVDCAIAKVVNSKLVSGFIAFVGFPNGSSVPRLNEEVKKAGRTTELTTGKITAIKVTTVIQFGTKKVYFKNQIFTTGMSEMGDSGALLLNKNNIAMGLLIGGSSTCTVYNDITTVLKELNVTIVS